MKTLGRLCTQPSASKGVDDSSRRALQFLRQHVLSGPPLKIEKSIHSTWFVFTDGACDQEAKKGSIGGVLYNPPGVVLVVQLVSRHSCVADRLPVVVRFPAGPRVKTQDRRPAERQTGSDKKRCYTTLQGIACISLGRALLPDSWKTFSPGFRTRYMSWNCFLSWLPRSCGLRCFSTRRWSIS